MLTEPLGLVGLPAQIHFLHLQTDFRKPGQPKTTWNPFFCKSDTIHIWRWFKMWFHLIPSAPATEHHRGNWQEEEFMLLLAFHVQTLKLWGWHLGGEISISLSRWTAASPSNRVTMLSQPMQILSVGDVWTNNVSPTELPSAFLWSHR